MPAFIDLTDQTFGKWTVIERAANNRHNQTVWLCRCECGVERAVPTPNLRSGNSASCGCGHAIDLMVDEAFDGWTIIKRASNKGSAAMWLCRCECGTERDVNGSELRSRRSTNCGCRTQYNLVDLAGQISGYWTVIERVENDKSGNTMWWCRCVCGMERAVHGWGIRSGRSTHCGCRWGTFSLDDNGDKICTSCRLHLSPTTEFWHKSSSSANGWGIYCKRCGVDKAHRLTVDIRWQLLAAQGYTCGFPGCVNRIELFGKNTYSIDHNHRCCSGKSCGRCIRGLLCWSCNTMLTVEREYLFRRVPEYAEYLDRG